MTTTVESWVTDPSRLGPIYPLVGWEGLMFGACVVFSLLFIVWKMKTESAHYRDRVAQLSEGDALKKALGETER